ncbi:MAG: hypothetical protein ABF652_23895, partial [Clostridium beijerinckii]
MIRRPPISTRALSSEASDLFMIQDLANQDIVNFHPNVNTATIGISYKDFEKFILWRKNKFKYIEI